MGPISKWCTAIFLVNILWCGYQFILTAHPLWLINAILSALFAWFSKENFTF